MAKSLLSEIAEIEKSEKVFHTHKKVPGGLVALYELPTHIHVPTQKSKKHWYFLTQKAFDHLPNSILAHADVIVVDGQVVKDRFGMYQGEKYAW